MKITVRPLSPELEKKAVVELNETPKRLEDGLRHMKEWIIKQPHLRARTVVLLSQYKLCLDWDQMTLYDQWLTAFLRGCKHSLEKVKEKLDLYYSLRNLTPDLFAFRPRNPKFKDLLKTGTVLVLPKLLNPLDPRVIYIRPALYDANLISASDFFSFSHTIQQIMYLEDDAYLVNGSVSIIDLEGLSIPHFLQMTPIMMKKLVVAAQDASPLRIKSIHLINSMPVFEKIFNIGIKFVNEKHSNRIFVHSKNLDAVHKYIPKEILPEEFGGNGGTTQEIIDYWVKKIDEYMPWLDEDVLYGTDESKRPGKPRSADTMFGVDGSFRQLEVD